MNKTSALALLGLATLCACGERPAAEPPPDATLNPGSTLNGTQQDRPAGRANAEDPDTGRSVGRPDSPKDLQPGTDGNTNPPQP